MRWVLNNIDATQKQYISWFWHFQDYNDRALSTWIQYIPIYMNIVRLTAEQRWFSRLPRWYYYQHRVNAMLNIKTSINTAIHEMTVAMPFGIDDSTTTYMISRTVSIIYDITTIYIYDTTTSLYVATVQVPSTMNQNWVIYFDCYTHNCFDYN